MTRHACLCLSLLSAVAAHAQNYRFTFDPAHTWTDGTVVVRAYSQGTFKGNFGETGWPYWTQTKWGAGTFGAVDNDPIPAYPFWEMGHAEFLRTNGTFTLSVDPANLRATLSEYTVERSSPDGVNLTTTVALNNDAFRSRNPTASYSASLPPVRLGTFHIDKFRVVQKPGSRSASIVPLGGSNFGVAITFMATLSFRIQEFGGFLVSFDTPASLVGLLQLNGTTAVFGHPTGRGGDNFSRPVTQAVPPFAVTFIDGHVPPPIFKLTTTLTRVDVRINGARKALANGVRF